LCLELDGRYIQADENPYSAAIKDGENIILQTDNFVVIPSLGPLNNTHAMLIPKQHVNSFASLPVTLQTQGMEILRKLSQHALTKNEELIFFESGAGLLMSHSGGCVTHAHIHCIKKNEHFERELKEEVTLTKTEGDDFSQANTDLGYIWYRNEKDEAYLCNNPLLPSQFLRYLYAKPQGNDTRWNWRKNVNIPVVMKVLSFYKKEKGPSK
jgi:diadenosine tetraphosphate (Ap4A) HIT family hydrolase